MVYPEDYRKDIELAIEYLSTFSISEIYLFGSLVNGSFTKDSDIDIAVRGMESMDFFLAIAELQGKLEHRLDLVNLDFKDEFTETIEKSKEFVRVA